VRQSVQRSAALGAREEIFELTAGKSNKGVTHAHRSQ
jgi:hypothetical protein